METISSKDSDTIENVDEGIAEAERVKLMEQQQVRLNRFKKYHILLHIFCSRFKPYISTETVIGLRN